MLREGLEAVKYGVSHISPSSQRATVILLSPVALGVLLKAPWCEPRPGWKHLKSINCIMSINWSTCSTEDWSESGHS